jgi:type II secretory pathway component HofQ
MSKLIATLLLSGLALMSLAQTTLPTVNVKAKGEDVRSVLHELFGQAKKNYVLEPGIRYALYLSLEGVEFEEALQLVCKNASLKYELQNGIYFVDRDSKVQSTPAKSTQPAKPKGKLPETVLNKLVTTRFDKIDIRALFENISKQTGVTIEIDKSVPAYKLDAYLLKTSLKFALTTICEAARLKYTFTENQTLLLTPKKDGEDSRVSMREN